MRAEAAGDGRFLEAGREDQPAGPEVLDRDLAVYSS
jgi:hypothetical protein